MYTKIADLSDIDIKDKKGLLSLYEAFFQAACVELEPGAFDRALRPEEKENIKRLNCAIRQFGDSDPLLLSFKPTGIADTLLDLQLDLADTEAWVFGRMMTTEELQKFVPAPLQEDPLKERLLLNGYFGLERIASLNRQPC